MSVKRLASQTDSVSFGTMFYCALRALPFERRRTCVVRVRVYVSMCDYVVPRVHRKMAWSSTMKSNKLQNATGGNDRRVNGDCLRSGGPFSGPDVVSFSPVAFLDFAHLADRRSKIRPFVLVRPLTGKKTKNSRRRRRRRRCPRETTTRQRAFVSGTNSLPRPQNIVQK